MAANVRVDMTPAPVFFTNVNRKGGDVDGAILRRAERVAVAAKGLAPVRSGRLAASIRVDRNRNAIGQYDFGYRIQPTVSYTKYAIGPTSPHVIQGSPYLAYEGGLSGRVIVKGPIMHPGTGYNNFMTRALRAAAG